MKPLNKIFDRVSCKACLEKLESAPRNEHNFPLLSDEYDCGNMADGGLGHQYVYTKSGKTALCIVPIRKK